MTVNYSFFEKAIMMCGFNDPASQLMIGIIDLHHYIFFFIIVILGFVFWNLFSIVYSFTPFSHVFVNKNHWSWGSDKGFTPTYAPHWSHNQWKSFVENVVFGKTEKFVHGRVLEIVWTLIPVVILVLISIPSIALLFASDLALDPVLTFKAIGHQWWWEYEYSDIFRMEMGYQPGKGDPNVRFWIDNLTIESHMVPDAELTQGALRLLEVSQPLILPTNVPLRVLVTADDVLHCWAVPSLGIKMDAVPGRLNEVAFCINRTGVFYGQCSEICGANHGFMPIVIEALPFKAFENFLADLIRENYLSMA